MWVCRRLRRQIKSESGYQQTHGGRMSKLRSSEMQRSLAYPECDCHLVHEQHGGLPRPTPATL